MRCCGAARQYDVYWGKSDCLLHQVLLLIIRLGSWLWCLTRWYPRSTTRTTCCSWHTRTRNQYWSRRVVPRLIWTKFNNTFTTKRHDPRQHRWREHGRQKEYIYLVEIWVRFSNHSSGVKNCVVLYYGMGGRGILDLLLFSNVCSRTSVSLA